MDFEKRNQTFGEGSDSDTDEEIQALRAQRAKNARKSAASKVKAKEAMAAAKKVQVVEPPQAVGVLSQTEPVKKEQLTKQELETRVQASDLELAKDLF